LIQKIAYEISLLILSKGLFFVLLERYLRMLKRVPIEALSWSTGLLLLAIMDTGNDQFSLCPLANMELRFCPGCGLGRSISYFFHGDIAASVKTHPLGIVTIVMLLCRITTLTKHFIHNYGKSY